MDPAYNAFASSVKGRGLAFIDDGAAARRGGGMARATAERVIDDKLSGPAIDQQLMALEGGALQRGQALGSGFAYPHHAGEGCRVGQRRLNSEGLSTGAGLRPHR